jgi:hypothetical protein
VGGVMRRGAGPLVFACPPKRRRRRVAVRGLPAGLSAGLSAVAFPSTVALAKVEAKADGGL